MHIRMLMEEIREREKGWCHRGEGEEPKKAKSSGGGRPWEPQNLLLKEASMIFIASQVTHTVFFKRSHNNNDLQSRRKHTSVCFYLSFGSLVETPGNNLRWITRIEIHCKVFKVGPKNKS